MNKSRIISAIIINGFIFLSVTAVIMLLIFSQNESPESNAVEETFKYFTNLSNIFCALVSLAAIIFEVRILTRKEKEFPHMLRVLKHMGTTAVALTFFTVLCFLAPISGSTWYLCYSGYIFFLHFMDPLLAIICFVFLENAKPLSFKECLFAVIPTLAYIAVYAPEVLIFRNWDDFYGFTFGGKVWAPFVIIPVMTGATYLLSFLLSSLQRKNSRQQREKKTN